MIDSVLDAVAVFSNRLKFKSGKSVSAGPGAQLITSILSMTVIWKIGSSTDGSEIVGL